MKLDDGRLTFVAQQEVTALDAIHKAALGKAACAGRVTEGVGTCISIHAPTWGATPCFFKDPLNSSNFNPRTHVGCDFCYICEPVTAKKISIHAPTWGATQEAVTKAIDLQFQSTHPRGVRPMSASLTGRADNDFNPRTHVGCDSILGYEITGVSDFNPRTHVGCDGDVRPRGLQAVISIHAPTWGATREALTKLLKDLFQSTHPRGVRPGVREV